MSASAIHAEWIAVDWGTSRLRAWAMQGANALAEAQSPSGMSGLTRDGYEPALMQLVQDWLGPDTTPVVACGMVGAKQGWTEAPYQTIPCKPLSGSQVSPVVNDPRLDVHILAGVKSEKPADVMRGEETQIAGFLALNPGWDGVICLPGTHTKWAHVSAGEIVSFQTFMTGEIFNLLGNHSVLRHSVGGTGWDDDAFAEALNDSRSRPERLAASLFALRAEDLLHNLPAATARARLSGLLIGAELIAARRYWLGQNVAIIGADATSKPYAAALAMEGVPATVANGTRMTQAGLTAAYRSIRNQT